MKTFEPSSTYLALQTFSRVLAGIRLALGDTLGAALAFAALLTSTFGVEEDAAVVEVGFPELQAARVNKAERRSVHFMVRWTVGPLKGSDERIEFSFCPARG
jgi:hypothetical protein